MPTIAHLFSRAIDIYMLIVLVNVLLSWVVFGIQNTTVRQIYWITGQVVDPVLQPIRNILNPVSRNIGIDFSPIVLLFLLHVLNRMLIS